MDAEPDEDTVVRPPQPVTADPADVDADTVVRERVPFALVEPAPVESALPEPVEPPAAPATEQSTAPLNYSFTVNSHPPIGLDAPAFIGRRPSLPRIVQGLPPRLVRVLSPLREVSSTHLELRQQGALVVVTDLRSTNGTVVRAPGQQPVTLRGGESVVVMPGTVVDIGDGNIIEILPLARVESSGTREGREQ